jgi:hypothetical protein
MTYVTLKLELHIVYLLMIRPIPNLYVYYVQESIFKIHLHTYLCHGYPTQCLGFLINIQHLLKLITN